MATKAAAKKTTPKKASAKTPAKKSAAKKTAVNKTAPKKAAAKKSVVAAKGLKAKPATVRAAAKPAARPASKRAAKAASPSVQDDARQQTRRMVLAAAAACEDKKAEDIRILELDPADSGFTDFFLIASGTNERQVQAIGDAIEMKMKQEFATYANSVEGRRQSEWILIDYVDFVVHIFSAEKRAFYDIERLRKSARPVDLEQLKMALSEKTTELRKAAAKNASKARVVP